MNAKRKLTVKKKSELNETFPPERAISSLRSAITKLLDQCKFTDEEIIKELSEKYSTRKGLSLDGINNIRRVYNVKRAMLGEKPLSKLIRDDDGNLVAIHKIPPISITKLEEAKRMSKEQQKKRVLKSTKEIQ